MNIQDLFLLSFQGLQALSKQSIRTAHLRFNLVLIITILPRFILIDMLDHMLPSPEASKVELVLPRIPE